MKKLTFILVLAILLGGGALGAMSTPSQAQGYAYPPPPQNPYANPWVGPNTPWVHYNGDWFLNGILYYFFGPQYGWAPYYSYAPTYIVRPETWYAPMWHTWYQGNPRYYETFRRQYPYWSTHRVGERYGPEFYERHHRGQGSGWQKGFQGRPAAQPSREERKPGPARVAPPEGQKPGPSRVAPREEQKPAPARVAPREEQKRGPARVTPQEEQKRGPARVAPQEGQKSGPARVAPQEGQKSGPARVAPPEGRKPAPAPGAAPAAREKAPAAKPEKGPSGGEEKH
jgi:hypothetical protein